MRGIAATEEKNRDAKAGAASAMAGPRRATGVTRINPAVPTMGFGAESQARIEQSFCPGIPFASQLLLSLWRLRPWRWCTGQ